MAERGKLTRYTREDCVKLLEDCLTPHYNGPLRAPNPVDQARLVQALARAVLFLLTETNDAGNRLDDRARRAPSTRRTPPKRVNGVEHR